MPGLDDGLAAPDRRAGGQLHYRVPEPAGRADPDEVPDGSQLRAPPHRRQVHAANATWAEVLRGAAGACTGRSAEPARSSVCRSRRIPRGTIQDAVGQACREPARRRSGTSRLRPQASPSMVCQGAIGKSWRFSSTTAVFPIATQAARHRPPPRGIPIPRSARTNSAAAVSTNSGAAVNRPSRNSRPGNAKSITCRTEAPTGRAETKSLCGTSPCNRRQDPASTNSSSVGENP